MAAVVFLLRQFGLQPRLGQACSSEYLNLDAFKVPFVIPRRWPGIFAPLCRLHIELDYL